MRSCHGHAACHCAIAIKVDDDVILVDSCGPERAVDDRKRRPFYPVVYMNGDLTYGVHILKVWN